METPLISSPSSEAIKISNQLPLLQSIVTPNVVFVLTTVITIYSYFAAAQGANWRERDINNITFTSWSASLSVVFALGLLALRNGPPISYWASLLILPSTLIYAVISDLPGLSLSAEGMTKTPMGVTTLVISGICGFIYLMYVIYNLFGKTPYEILMFFLPVTVYIIWILLWFATDDIGVKKQNIIAAYVSRKTGPDTWSAKTEYIADPNNPVITGKYKLYLHHWMIGLIGFFISKHQTIINDLGLGIFWGIFVHSLASYGIDIPVN